MWHLLFCVVEMIEYKQSKSFVEAFTVLPMLNGLDELYPDFEYWYVNTMIPGLITGNDVLLLAKEHGQNVGVALGKVTDEETKLRCVRVLPQYQNKGTGLHLIERMLKLLNTDKPHCTVAEEMIHAYSRAFINYFNFILSRVDKGRYRPGKLEYVFN
jgi:GNAT superfamily N-acetyltransferase